jgi:hypothetical protein
MAVSTQHEVTQFDGGDHPVLDPGDYHVKGVIEAHGPLALCSEQAKLSAAVISVSRTSGGGIAYEFAISKEEPAPPKQLSPQQQAAAEQAAAKLAEKAAEDAAFADGQKEARLARAKAAGAASVEAEESKA